MTSLQSLMQSLQKQPIIGILRSSNTTMAQPAAVAALEAGMKHLEVTFTIPKAEGLITQLKQQHPSAVIGAGTVLTIQDAQKAVHAGADFLISPHLNLEVSQFSQHHNIPYIPGVLTPTEIQKAIHAGHDLLKIFPVGALGGASYLRDLKGPFPDLKIVATGGIQPSQLTAHLKAGALAVGLGSQVFSESLIQKAAWNAIHDITRDLLLSLERKEDAARPW